MHIYLHFFDTHSTTPLKLLNAKNKFQFGMNWRLYFVLERVLNKMKEKN